MVDVERLLIDEERVNVLVECVDVGVLERIYGLDPGVFVLLNDDVDPPVDVDCLIKLDADVVKVARRIVGVIALGRGLVVVVDCLGEPGWTTTERFVWGGILCVVVVFVDNMVAVCGRPFGKLGLPFDEVDGDGFVTDCLTREEAIRGTTPVFRAESCNNTQTYTQMYNSVYLKNTNEKKNSY